MGTDIHYRVQKLTTAGAWETQRPGKQPDPYKDGELVEEWPRPRDYRFFALVAGVRNGAGFAGVYTHDPIEPISEPRGLPPGFVDEYQERDDDPNETYEEMEAAWKRDRAAGIEDLGDHSFSWLTLAELQSERHWNQPITEGGIITLRQYAALRDGVVPTEWSGGIMGEGIVTLSAKAADAVLDGKPRGEWPGEVFIGGTSRLYVQAKFPAVPLREAICEPYKRLIFEYLPTVGEPDKVRLVFGFDS